MRERRIAGITTAKNSPEGRESSRRGNEARWADPAQHAALSEKNRRSWKTPAIRQRMVAGIKAAHGTPAARARHSERRREFWAIPENRARIVAAIKAAKSTPEARAKFGAMLRERWKDPVFRRKWQRGRWPNGTFRTEPPTVRILQEIINLSEPAARPSRAPTAVTARLMGDPATSRAAAPAAPPPPRDHDRRAGAELAAIFAEMMGLD